MSAGKVMLDAGGSARVPPALLVGAGEDDVRLGVSVVGYGDDGLVITTSPVGVEVYASGYAECGPQVDLPPDVAQQIYAEMAALRKYVTERGVTYVPDVSPEGVISWSNDGGRENPVPRNIRGERGERGLQGERGERGERGEQGIQGIPGERGETGAQGERGAGVPAGGKAGQVLGKRTEADDDTAWVDVARIDDAAIGADAWSSRHTVDMLCPPLDASGNPVVCNPVAGYPLGVAASWVPMQEGEGEPSPDNVRPIVGRDAVSVTRCGKNMLDYAGTIVIPQANYSVKAPTELYNAILKLPRDTPLTMIAHWQGYSTNASTRQITLFGANGARVGFVNAIPIAIPKNMTITSVLIYAGMDKAQDCTVQDIQFFAGGEASQYKPYRGDTHTLTLPRTVYGGEVDVGAGEGQETWMHVVLDGTEGWSSYPAGSLRETTQYRLVGFNPQGCVCSHYASRESMPQPNNTIHTGKNFGYSLNICDGRYTTIDDWKAYLAAQYAAGTPVTIAYKLAAPVPFTATGGGVLPALDGVNTVYTDADSVRVTGRTERMEVDESFELIEEITLAEDTVSILRNTTPDGTPYNMKRLMCIVALPNGNTDRKIAWSYNVNSFAMSTYYASATSPYALYLSFCASVIDGRLFCMNAVARTAPSGGSNMSNQPKSVAELGYHEANAITAIGIREANNIGYPSGTVIKIYGVRA